MKRVGPWALLASLVGALVSGCGQTNPTNAASFEQPSSVAFFNGYTTKNPGSIHPYIAVANGARNDLTLIDTLDENPVLSPVLVRPLTVLTGAGCTPSATNPCGPPMKLVGTSLADNDYGIITDTVLNTSDYPISVDLLAVFFSGSPQLQVVSTWTNTPEVDNSLTVDLSNASGVAEGSQILTAVAVPVASGSVRIVMALSEKQLAVVEYDRAPSKGPQDLSLGIVLANPTDPVTVLSLEFQPIDLAVSPDGTTIYAATLDDLPAGSGQYGVVRIDATGTPGNWPPPTMLPARAPTRLVATTNVVERDFSFPSLTVSTPAAPRVYAVLDPSSCGDTQAIGCGIVTIDPVQGGIVPDPLGELPYQPPVRIPAYVMAMLPAVAPLNEPLNAAIPAGMFSLTGAYGITGGVLGVAATDGRFYAVDLGRRTLTNSLTMLDTQPITSTQSVTRVDTVTLLEATAPPPLDATEIPEVQSCSYNPLSCTYTSNLTSSASSITVTPGYTRDDVINIQYQGVLPSLGGFGNGQTVPVAPRVITGTDSSGDLVVAPVGSLSDTVSVWDPALGAHVGDIVQIATFGSLTNTTTACCAGITSADDDPSIPYYPSIICPSPDFTIDAILPPDSINYPGGALVVKNDGSACMNALTTGAGVNAWMTVRTSDWLVTSNTYGYMGRGVVTTPPGSANMNVHVEVRYSDEFAPSMACPLDPWPARPDLVSCDDACRARCEALHLTRLARRWYTVAESCDTDTTGTCSTNWSGNPARSGLPPNQTGPLLEFDFTLVHQDPAVRFGVSLIPTNQPEREVGLSLSVKSGTLPIYFVPSGDVVLPTGITTFDHSAFSVNSDYRFYVSYIGNQVIDLSPSETTTAAVNIR